ncbi:MAG: M1 family metallopeptidase [Acidobacteriota bacterium]
MRRPQLLLLALSVFVARHATAQDFSHDRFRQLDELLPTPNVYRTASGAPGHQYWQQQADHDIEVEIDDENQRIIGTEKITYTNNSPDTLRYLWVQLENNIFSPKSNGALASIAPSFSEDKLPFRTMSRLVAARDFDGSVHVTRIASSTGKPLPHRIVDTMMRIDLPTPLAPGQRISFHIDWNYDINDATTVRARTGYEYFEDDGNYIYELAHWFPRMASYTDYAGWQNKSFIGSGEFTLEFGDYDVAITVPADHVVAATGVLQNPDEVLEQSWRRRLREAESADELVFIVTPEEAEANEKSRSTEKKTWRFHAENVRDFAFASSRKFIWDAWLHDMNGHRVWAMSAYPKEAEPLWSKYSTHAIIHTLDVYSRYTFRYPYPVAWSVNGPVGGMEYPMICFNGPRTEDDGTYTDQSTSSKDGKYWNRSKYGLISVIIHEVGHNYFPMIVNSDERQWTWMDEGLNTFLQSLAEQEWEEGYPSRRGEPKDIVEYMTSENQVPIMTNSESVIQFGSNAYGKPATALNVLRSTVMGEELFDEAFREFARRWQFKRPEPADFFRTMEDASAVDLDWFWRGWFYTTDHVDIAVTGVRLHTVNTEDPDIEKPRQESEREEEPTTRRESWHASAAKRVDRYPELKDFYNEFDELDVTPQDREKFEELMAKLEDDEAALLGNTLNFYVIDFENLGGLVMPLILDVTYDGTDTERVRIPAEIWRRDARRTSKLFMTDREITAVALDPQLETADSDRNNNHWPAKAVPSRFKLFKEEKKKNAMQLAAEAEAEASTSATTSKDER